MTNTRHTLQLTLLSCLSLLTACCGSEKQLVEQSADSYLNAMAYYNFDEAQKYATPRTQEVTLSFIKQEIMPYLDSSYIQKNTPAKIKIKKINMTSDSTATVFYHKSTPIKEADDSLQLVKIDNEWRANQVIVIPGSGTSSNIEMAKKKSERNPFAKKNQDKVKENLKKQQED